MFSSLNRRRGKLLSGNKKAAGGGGAKQSARRHHPSSSSYEEDAPHNNQGRTGIPSTTSGLTLLDDLHDGGGSIHGIRSLIGGSGGVSLDGQSLTIPPSTVVYDPTSSAASVKGQQYHHNPGSPSMDNSIDMYSYTLSAQEGGLATYDDYDEHGGVWTDNEDDDLEGGDGGRKRTTPRGLRGWGAGCGAGNNFVVVGGGSGDDDDDDDQDHNKEEEADEDGAGSASAAMVMMGMSTQHNNNNNATAGNNPTSNADGTLIDQNHSDIAASSSASALFDGRSLQISSNEDDDMSSINSSSINHGLPPPPPNGWTPPGTNMHNNTARETGGEASSSLSSPPTYMGYSSPSPATSNKYLGPYGSKLKIIGSINLLNDDNTSKESGAAADIRASSRRIVQGPVGIAPAYDEQARQDSNNNKDDPDKTVTPFCGCRCAPLWIKRAPRWLQIVLFAAAVLALLAIVLVAVSVSLAFHARGSNSAAAAADASNAGMDDAPFVPPPSLLNNGTSTGNSTNGGSDDTTGALNNITNVSNNSSTSTNGSEAVVDWSALLRTSFAVTAGRYPDALAQIVPDLLPNFTTTRTVNTAAIPGDATDGEGPQMAEVESWLQFMVHLGDWNSPEYTNCVAAAYQEVANMFSTSTVPVFFVPGDNEYNDCTGQEQEALTRWRNTLVDYESSHWTLPFTTETRQIESFVENFAFVYRQVIFVGLNLVSGNVFDQDIWDARLASDLAWVEQAYDAYHTVARAMVLFSHSSPDNTLNTAFFDPLLANVSSSWTDLEFVIMHRNNPGQVMEQTLQYDGIANLQVVSVLGSVWPPLRATVMIDMTTESGSGVTVQVEQDTLYQETPSGS